MTENVKVVYILGKKKFEFEVEKGSNLRRALLREGFSPYTKVTHNKNCGGMGICATCGVWIHNPEPDPTHWHDRIAKKHGYPRLSCQIYVHKPITVEAVEGKVLWGLRDMRRRKINNKKTT